jgi:hypothetical protein
MMTKDQLLALHRQFTFAGAVLANRHRDMDPLQIAMGTVDSVTFIFARELGIDVTWDDLDRNVNRPTDSEAGFDGSL